MCFCFVCVRVDVIYVYLDCVMKMFLVCTHNTQPKHCMPHHYTRHTRATHRQLCCVRSGHTSAHRQSKTGHYSGGSALFLLSIFHFDAHVQEMPDPMLDNAEEEQLRAVTTCAI